MGLPRIGGIGVELEAVKGVVETIVVADMVLADKGSVKKTTNAEDREAVRDDIMPLGPLPGGETCEVSIPAWLRGSGTAGTKSVLDDILEACAVDMTDDAGFAVRGVLPKALATVEGITVKDFSGDKQVTATGVVGNATFVLEAGVKGMFNFEGQGVKASDGDEGSLAAPSDTPKPPVFINGKTNLLEHHATTEDDADGDGALLRGTATFGFRLCKTIAQGSTTQKVWGVAVRIKKIGTPATETDGTFITIEGDEGGDPDESPITHGTSQKIVATLMTDTDWEWVIFEMGSFGNRPELTAATDWHFCLQGDAALADDNSLSIGTDVVAAPDQNSQEQASDAGDYTALALENLSMHILVAPDVENFFDGVEINLNNEVAARTDPNATEGIRYFDINSRGAGTMATMAPLEKLDADQDFYQEHKDCTDMFLIATLGDTAGNIFEFYFRHCVLREVTSWEDRDGRQTHPLVAQLTASADFELVER